MFFFFHLSKPVYNKFLWCNINLFQNYTDKRILDIGKKSIILSKKHFPKKLVYLQWHLKDSSDGVF